MAYRRTSSVIQIIFLVGSLGLFFTAAGCDTSRSAGTDLPERDKKEDSAQKTGSKKKTVSIDPIRPNLSQSGRQLARNFEGFLSRTPIGFGLDVFSQIWRDITEKSLHSWRAIKNTPTEFAVGAAKYLLTLLAIWLLLLLVERPLHRWFQTKQARFHLPGSLTATRVVRSALMLSRRVLPAFAVLVASYFPIQALFSKAPWTLWLTDILWLVVIYRLVHGFISLVLSNRLEARHPDQFRSARFVSTVIFQLLLALGSLYAAIDVFDYREDAQVLVVFSMKVVVASSSLYFLTHRSTILHLFPTKTDSKLYSYLRSTIARYYYWLFGLTLFLLVFWIAGYQNATHFLLVRGYSILLLVLLASYLAGLFKRFIERQIEDGDYRSEDEIDHGSEGGGQLLRSIEKLVLLAGTLILIVTVLNLCFLYGPLVALLASPFIKVGNVALSVLGLIKVALIAFGTILAVKILKAILNTKIYPAYSVDVGTGYALNTLLNYAILAIGFFVALAALGVNLSTLTVVMASLGVGIGFGLQTLTENLISGFIILFGRSVEKGDIITVNDTYGEVQAVGARSVVVRTPDNVEMLIPSKEIVGGQIINWTYQDSRIRLHIPVGVSYKADPEQVKEVLLDVARRHDSILKEPKPDVWLVEFGASSVNFELLAYFDCKQIPPARLKGQLYYNIWNKLHEEQIQIPFPQRDIHIKSGRTVAESANLRESSRLED